jgi:hypothetical protein
VRRRALLVALSLVVAGARADAPPADAEFLEFLGSMEGDDEGFDGYLAVRERRPPSSGKDEARVERAEQGDADTR